MPIVAQHTAKGLIVIATLLVVVSIGAISPLLNGWTTAFHATPVLATLAIASACVGVITAVGLWRDERWALWIYLVWLGLFFAHAIAADSQVESVTWKLVIGAVLRSTLPCIGAAYLIYVYKGSRRGQWQARSEQRTRALSDTPPTPRSPR